MKDPLLTIIEHHPSGTDLPGKTIHQTITTWLTKELTNDACAVLSAQAFQINPCSPTASAVS